MNYDDLEKSCFAVHVFDARRQAENASISHHDSFPKRQFKA